MSQQPYYNAGDTSAPPVVVQGVYVNDPYTQELQRQQRQQQSTATYYNNNNVTTQQPTMTYYNQAVGDYEKVGEVQPRRCNDVAFAILFYAHLAVMLGVTAAYAPRAIGEVASAASSTSTSSGNRDLSSSHVEDEEAGVVPNARFASWIVGCAHRCIIISSLSASPSSIHNDNEQRYLQENSNEENGETHDVGDMLLLLGISALIALLLSSGVMGVMIRHAEALIKVALVFNVVCTGVFAIGSFFISPFSALIGIFLFVFTIYYVYAVWGRIPFAASNLVVATTAVKSNLGLSILAYSSLPIMLGWSCWWLVSFVSTVYVASGCDGQGNCASEPPGILVFALLLSYYWTFQVIKNVVHVTVAGAVGTWWFVPSEGTSFCSDGVKDSLVRSITTSFGSICLGSLLVAIIEALKTMVRNLRESEDGGGILLCLAECILACLADMMEYFNMWAFVFVGLYGYPFMEAGKNVLTLFQTRGWTTIITDNLSQGVLGLVSVAVGLVTGLVSFLIAQGSGMVLGDELGATAAAFFIGFITGAVLTSTLLTLVSSAVNTVIVCYAEAPREFEENHPQLSQDMRAAWRQAWPDEFQY